MQIALYFAPFSCAFVPYVLLTEAGADFEVRPINIRGKENMSPEYLALNPKHKVPLLIVDGKPLSENVAIQLWISQQFPDAQLFPSDPWDKVQAISHCAWFAAGVHPYISRYNMLQKSSDHTETSRADMAKTGQGLLTQFALADKMLEGRDLLFEKRSAPDIYLHWCFRRSSLFDLDLSAYKNVQRHSELLKTFPSIQKADLFDAECKEKFGL